MLSVGYASRHSAISSVGPWRTVLLLSMIQGYLDAHLHTTRYFRNLEQSEKAAMSFLLGQAFTYWFAQTHMNIPYIVHVKGAGHSWTPATRATVLKPGAGPFRPRARPDFIGQSLRQYHVFEAKGRSSKISAAVREGALAQVSMIGRINNLAPVTRVAACFSFQPNGVTGHLQDPAAEPKALDLKFDDVAATEKAYAFFLQPDVRDGATEKISGFLCVDLGDDLTYGIDKKVLGTLDDLRSLVGAQRTAEPLLEFLAGRRSEFTERSTAEQSVGPDGIILSAS